MSSHSYLSNADGKFIEELYARFQEDPESVEFGWRKFFEGVEFARETYGDDAPSEGVLKEINVLNLIHGYRIRGHLFTDTNPVRERRKYEPSLDKENFGLSDADLNTVFQAGNEVGLGPAKLKDIIALLKETYCTSIGVEFMQSRNTEIVNWFTKKMESSRNRPDFSIDEKKHILKKLNQAVAFETFLGSKYVGQKRFSLEGVETLIPALDAVVEKGTDLGVEEFVIGMAHRGRLNVLANTLGKTYDDIFSEFEGLHADDDDGSVFDGDVKYHMGYGSDVKTEKGDIAHISLCPNPSHLESVDPVAEGVARAKIDLKYEGDASKLTTILIHGDASIAGQGVVYEVTQMSELGAYQTGGTMHIVVNNQVGFTTNYLEGRSSTYCTDVAKVTASPVFHVNADDVEAVVFAVELAMEFRQKFHKDVFIDLLGYRRHGHNEADEPRFTQPNLYKAIEKHPDPRKIYFEKLREGKTVEANLAKEMEKSFKRFLLERQKEVKQNNKAVHYDFEESGWGHLKLPTLADWNKEVKTGVDEKTLRPLAESIVALPEDKDFYSKYARITQNRAKMLNETDSLDWAMGELMAYASLLAEGKNVRMSGQDVQRGTFSHRHAVVLVNGEEHYVPLNNLSENQGKFEIYNSHLSEFAVLGFEYGYSWSAPETLSIWEAQFGDFVNGAQVIIDQYISSALAKWKRVSGLVMFLPHGFEGQGPEHSSARLERFLELCAGNNMQVTNPTTPANHFHMLRRQLHREFRSPMIVMTPKSLLRHPKATSSFSDFTSGSFQEVIDDPDLKNGKGVKKVLLCTGKVYYDLKAKQEEAGRKDVAVIRMEQLYPVPFNRLEELKKKYKSAKEWVWVQEEPANMGSWPFIMRHLNGIVDLAVISRKENSTPATGFKKQHESQQAYILNRAFDIVPEKDKK